MNIKCHKPKSASENCQFESLYKNIVDQHYPNFAEDFFEHDQKFYCPFHAPMDAVKIGKPNFRKTKKEIFGIYPKIKDPQIYSDKFWNVIYGIINQQTASFSPRFQAEDWQNYPAEGGDKRIDFESVVFPKIFQLTKVQEVNFLPEEHKKYSKTSDVIMPYMNFHNCEFYSGIGAHSGSQEQMQDLSNGNITQKVYPQLIIFGANFYGACFRGSITFIGVNFAPKKQHTLNSVSFDKAKFECVSIEFSKSEFHDLTLRNSKIFCHHLRFTELLIHSNFDISCDRDADEDLKKIKNPNSISFRKSSFGHESTYQKIRTLASLNDPKSGEDIGGKLICKNRIFENDVFFKAANSTKLQIF